MRYQLQEECKDHKAAVRCREARAGAASPASLVGKRVVCPGSVFNEADREFIGKVVNTPRKSRPEKRKVYVRFEEDDSTYWWAA